MCIKMLIAYFQKAHFPSNESIHITRVCLKKWLKLLNWVHFHNVSSFLFTYNERTSVCVYCWNLKAGFGLLGSAIELLDGIIPVELLMLVTPEVIRRALETTETRWSNRCRAGVHRHSSIIYPAFHFSSIRCSLQCAECFIVMARPPLLVLGFHRTSRGRTHSIAR